MNTEIWIFLIFCLTLVALVALNSPTSKEAIAALQEVIKQFASKKK